MKQINRNICIAIIAVFIFFLTVSVIMNNVCEAQTAKILSPSISIRDAKISPNPIDYEFSMMIWKFGNNMLYFCFERESGRFYREREFRIQSFGVYIYDYQVTSRNIWNTEIGVVYRYKKTPFSAGASLVFDNWGRANKVAVMEYKGDYLSSRYIRGSNKWITDTNFLWGAPLGKEILKVGSISFQPAYQLLLRYYQDEMRKNKQAKISLELLFKKNN